MKPYLYELLARKTVVVWAESPEEAREVMENEFLLVSNEWEGMEARGGDEPISEEIAAVELRHGALESRP